MNAPIVELQGVEIRLGGRTILSSVDLRLEEGISWALLGANGSGKSSLLRVLRGELWIAAGLRRFHLGGAPEESPIGARQAIGLVSPELQQAYLRRDWGLTCEAVVRSGFTDEVWPPEAATPEQAERISEVMAELGVLALAPRSILELSSGEARKVLLARALVNRPRLLLLDEPCHGLDASARNAFLGLLSRVAAGGLPLVLATHRHDELIPEIRRAAVLHAGRILAQGGRDEVLHAHAARAAARASARPPTPREAELPPRAPGEVLFSASHADVLVAGRAVLRDLDWTVRGGESWAVVGPNGAGKSTLVRLMVGDEQAMPGGRVRRLDLGERADVWEVKARVGVASPEIQARHRADTAAEEVVASGLSASIGLTERPTPTELERAHRAMERLGVAHLAGRGVHGLSYGEVRRLVLARALVNDPELVLLDEPCDGLDAASRAALLSDVEALCRAGHTVVLVTHHLEDVVPSIENVLELRAGRAVYAGPRAAWRGGAA